MTDATRPAPDTPDVSVIVVNHNGAALLEPCLRALAAAASCPSTDVLVVDNASTDGSLALLDRLVTALPGIRVLRSATNLGYAGGVNLALRMARGRYVAVLNPDMVVGADWLAPLVAWLDTHPQTGAVNPLIVLEQDPGTVNAAGQDIHVTGLGFNRWLWRAASRVGTTPMRVSGLQGGAIVIRRAVLEQTGGWDDSGFLYHEDVELSWLLHLLGHDLYCVPASVVRHAYRLTMYPEKLFLLERNRWAMLCGNLAPASYALLAPWLACTELFMWGYCLWRGPRFLKAKWASYQWVRKQWPQIRERRHWIRSVRRCTDWQLLRGLMWRYTWGQFFALARERGGGKSPSRL